MLESEQLIFDIYPSRLLMLALISVHLLAFVSIAMFYDTDAWYLALILTVIPVSSLIYGLRHVNSVKRVSIAPAGACTLVMADGRAHEAQLSDNCYCSDWLTILAFRESGSRRTDYALIMPDSVNPVMLKKLRALMKTSLFNAEV